MTAKPIKILLIGIVALILILIIIVFLLPLIINNGDFTRLAKAETQKRTGRELVFHGRPQLHIYPKPSLATGPISLSSPADVPGAFLSVDNLAISLQFWPLLAKQIHADKLHIQGLKLHLTTNKKGINNWDHGWPHTNDEKPTHWPNLLASLAIQDFRIDNAQIIWDNQKTGQKIIVDQLAVKTPTFGMIKPLHSQFSLTVRNANNPITVAIQGQSTLQLDKQLAKITLLDNSLQATLTGAETLPKPTAKLSLLGKQVHIDLHQQTLTAKALQFNAGDFTTTSELTAHLADNHYQVHGETQLAPTNPKAVMQQWGQSPPKLSDNTALQHLEGQLSFQYYGNSAQQNLVLKPLTITLDDSMLSGALSLNYQPKPTATANINIDTLNLDRYLPPKDRPTQPMKPATALASLPIETLRKFPISGTITIHTLNSQGSHLENLQLTLQE